MSYTFGNTSYPTRSDAIADALYDYVTAAGHVFLTDAYQSLHGANAEETVSVAYREWFSCLNEHEDGDDNFTIDELHCAADEVRERIESDLIAE